MKSVLWIIMSLISFHAVADKLSDKAKAKYRAAQHPKGSGIGTNRYNTEFNNNADHNHQDINKYRRTYQTEHMNDKQKAKYRAAQHPKGSGIGTNRYNTNYYGDYPIEKYQRVFPTENYQNN